MVPRAAARPRPTPAPARGYLRASAATTATSCGRSSSAGRPTGGTSCAEASASRRRARRGGPGRSSNRGHARSTSFRGRVMFPIFDVDGQAGRRSEAGSCPAADGPEVQELVGGPALLKRRVLYGLNWAKEDDRRQGEVIVCEGYTDVIGFHQAGVPRAVATCGTALTDEHLQLAQELRPPDRPGLRRRRRRAGARPSGSTSGSSRYELDVPCSRCPPGADPGELGASDPDRAAPGRGRGHAVPRLPGRPGARRGRHLSTAEGRARAAERGLGVDRRAPERAGPRPVPDAGGGSRLPSVSPTEQRRVASPGRARPVARPATRRPPVGGRASPRSRRPPGAGLTEPPGDGAEPRGDRRPVRGLEALRLADRTRPGRYRTGWRARRAACSPTRSTSTAPTEALLGAPTPARGASTARRPRGRGRPAAAPRGGGRDRRCRCRRRAGHPGRGCRRVAPRSTPRSAAIDANARSQWRGRSHQVDGMGEGAHARSSPIAIGASKRWISW